MLETQNSTPVAIAPFLDAPSLDAQRQALPIPFAGKPVFAGLMSAMVGEAGAVNAAKSASFKELAAPGFASMPLSSSSDLVLAQLGVKPLSAEDIELTEQALESLNLAENSPGLVKNEAELPVILPVLNPDVEASKSLPLSVAIASQENPFIRSVLKAENKPAPHVEDVVVSVSAAEPIVPREAAPSSSDNIVSDSSFSSDIIKAHALTNEGEVMPLVIELTDSTAVSPQPPLAAELTIVAASSSKPAEVAKADSAASVDDIVDAETEESVVISLTAAATAQTSTQTASESGQQNSQSSEKSLGSFDKIAPKLDKADVATTWGSQTQASAAAQTSGSSSQGGQPGQQQGQGQQAQQQALTQQMQQAQLATEQQTKNKFSEEMNSVKANEDRTANLLSDLGSGFDKRAQLPLGMQSINLPVRHSQWGQALGQRVVVMTNLKIQEAKITLNPEKLGPVQVKLHMDKDQQIHVSMLAQHGTTREAMENAIPKLKEMLEQAGIAFGSVNVGDHREFEQAQKEASHNGRKSGSGGAAEEELVEDSATNLLKSNNLVDYYA